MYTSPMPVPDYWRQAASDLDAGPAQQRVWFLPGQVSSDYRWSRQRPDDLGNALFSRPTLVRYVIPVTGGEAANLLQSVDQGLQEGGLPAGSLSKVARRLGVGDVLVRNDVVWETTGGARPQTVQTVVNADHGLFPVRNYGAPGENTVSPTVPPANAFEAALPPVQHYAVTDPADPLHAEDVQGTVVVSGDGFGAVSAMAAGVLPDGVPFRYAGDLDERSFAQVLRDGARIVLTDANRRRTTVSGRLTDGLGPLLRADQDPGLTRSLFGAADQTTLSTPGVRVDASMTGSVFGTLPQAAPVNAVDGDSTTTWWFGDFSTAVGQSLTVTSVAPARYGLLTLHTARQGAVRITGMRVAAGGRSVDVAVGPDGVARADLGGASSTTLTVTVTGIAGDGFTLVGLSEVSGLPLTVIPTAQLPDTVDRLVGGLPAAEAGSIASTPVDVVLSRVSGVAATPADDEERQLDRDFSLPVRRSYTSSGSVSAGPDVPEPELDRLAGTDGRIVAQSSSRAFDLPTVRASMAVDGSLGTGWAPAVPLGAWIRFTGQPRSVDSVTVTQPKVRLGGGWATRIDVLVDGRPVGSGSVGPGRHTIRVTPSVGRTVELRIAAVSGSGTVSLLETDAAGGTVTFDARRAAGTCTDVGLVDGGPLRVHLLAPVTSSAPVAFGPCGSGTLDLPAGPHQVRGSALWTLQSLVLRDSLGSHIARGTPPALTARTTSTSASVDVAASSTDSYLVLGQAYDSRWAASLDGRDLGTPVVVDGWSVGWRIPAGQPHHVEVRYRPQQAATVALVASLVGLGATGLLLGQTPRVDATTAPAPARRPRLRRTVVGAGVVAGSLFLGGWVAMAAAAVLVVWSLWRPPRTMTLAASGLALWAAAGVAFVVGNRSRWGSVTPELVTNNPWPGLLVLVGLVMLVTAVVRPCADGSSGTLPDRG